MDKKAKKTEKKKESVAKLQDVRDKEKALVRKSEGELIDQHKDNLKEYLEQRLFDFSYELKELSNQNKNISTIEMMNLIKKPKFVLGASPKYSPEELLIIFEYYCNMMIEINKIRKITPSLAGYCRLAGLTTINLRDYLKSDDSRYRNAVQMIYDYIYDISVQLAQKKEIDNITTIFNAKASLGVVEQQAPQVVFNVDTVDLVEAKRKLDMLKKGGTRNVIEIEGGD